MELSGFLPTSKEENKAFPTPPPPRDVVPLFELPAANRKHPNFEQSEWGKGVDCLFSEVTPFEDSISKIFPAIVALL